MPRLHPEEELARLGDEGGGARLLRGAGVVVDLDGILCRFAAAAAAAAAAAIALLLPPRRRVPTSSCRSIACLGASRSTRFQLRSWKKAAVREKSD